MKQIQKRIRSLLSTSVRFMHISYLEARSDYEGTRIGLFWMPLQTIIFAGLLGTVFHNPGEMTRQAFFLYVLSGYTCWTFISDSISGSVNIIQSKLDFAIHSGLSLGALFGKTLSDRLFQYGINLVVLLATLSFFAPGNLGWSLLLIIPLVAMLAATSLGLSYLINLTTVFFADLTSIIKTGARVMFFATPVFWLSSGHDGIRVALERYNPAAYYLNMSRQMVGIEAVEWTTWGISLGITLAVSGIGILAYRRTKSFVRNVK